MLGCPYCGLTHNVGLVSTRFAGTDGVSLEAAKWAEVFEKQGCRCYYFAGELDTPPGTLRLHVHIWWKKPISAIQTY